jgi:hypothetical protein
MAFGIFGSFWYIVWQFGIFVAILVHFPRFLYQEKSGNPGWTVICFFGGKLKKWIEHESVKSLHSSNEATPCMYVPYVRLCNKNIQFLKSWFLGHFRG